MCSDRLQFLGDFSSSFYFFFLFNAHGAAVVMMVLELKTDNIIYVHTVNILNSFE